MTPTIAVVLHTVELSLPCVTPFFQFGITCQDEEGNTQSELLLQAIEIAESEIESRARDAALHFNLGLESLCQKHQFTAREMTLLYERLQRARQQEVVRPLTLVAGETEVPFRVMHLGSRDTLKG